MAITLIGTEQVGAEKNGNDVTLTFDGSPTEDDVVILVGGISADQAGRTVGPLTAGYTQFAFEDWTADENLATGAWFKVMGATPDTTVVGQGGGFGPLAAAYASYMLRGVDTGTVEDAAEILDAGAENDPDLESITTATDGAWVFAFYNKNTQLVATAAPSGYSNLATAGIVDTERCMVAAARKEVASAGGEDPGIFTHANASEWKGYTIAIRPDVAAPAVYPPFPSRQRRLVRM